MAYTVPTERCGIASHLFLACLVWTIVVSIPPPMDMEESEDLCRFCRCSRYGLLNCMGVFREGSILERLSTEEDLTHLNIAKPPTKLSSELFEQHRNVTELDLSRNSISSLEDDFLFLFRRVRILELSYNEFQQIPKMGNNTFLYSLLLRVNMIREIPKALRFDAPNMSNLVLSENHVMVLHGSHLPQQLTSLNLAKNKIVALSQDALEGLNLLKSVDLSHNEITVISSHALSVPSLTRIHLDHNRIAMIEPSALSEGVTDLLMSGYSLRNLSYINGLSTLKALYLLNLNDIDTFTHVPEIEGLRSIYATEVRSPEIVSIMLSISPVMDELSVTDGRLEELHGMNHSMLRYLDLSSNRIRFIHTPFLMPSLESLQLRNNRILSLPNLSGLPKLRFLAIARNEIEELKKDDLLNLPNLNNIDLDQNKITISFDGYHLFRNLYVFSAANNQISDISHLILQKVRNLNLDGNNMKTFGRALVSWRNLNILSLNGNEIDVIATESFSDMTVLRVLSIAHNKITQIRELPSFPGLVSLTLDNNPLRFIEANVFISLPQLRRLSLRYTQMTTIPEIRGIFPTMRILDLQNNALAKFPVNITYNFPNLKTLNLNDNKIHNCPFDMLTSFTELNNFYISNNLIKEFDTGTTFPPKLVELALGSALTDYINPHILQSIAHIRRVELKGSRSVRIQNDLFCNTSEINDLKIDGLAFDSMNISCPMSIPSRLTLSNVVIDKLFLDMMVSEGGEISMSNMSLKNNGQMGNHSIVFAKEMQHISYINNKLSEVPRILAPSATALNLSGNHLTSISFGILTTFFPNLQRLSLSNNRIRVLSSCGMWSAHNPLHDLHLEGNQLGRFSRWMCEDGLVFLRAMNKLDLSNNNISLLNRDLTPPSLLENNYALTLYTYNNPLICNCELRLWLIKVKDKVEVRGGQCMAPQDNKGREISDLMDTDFPCQPMVSDNRICTIAANNTILVECPALAYPNPMVAWHHSESLEAVGNVGLFTNLSGSSSNSRGEGAEQQPLWLTLDDEILAGDHGDGAQNVFVSLTCLASNIRGSLAIDVSVNITFDAGRAATLSQRGFNHSLIVQCTSKGRTDGDEHHADESGNTSGNAVNHSSRVKIAFDETGGFLTLFCCFLVHSLSKL